MTKSPLFQHIQKTQDIAVRLRGILNALDRLEDDDLAADGRAALVGIAFELSNEIQRRLDSVALPKEVAA